MEKAEAISGRSIAAPLVPGKIARPHLIVKFRNDSRYGEGDPVDMGQLEMAYADMGRAAGLPLPKTRLIELTVNRKPETFFAVQRFDRDESRRIHFLSLAGYAYANHRVPCLDCSSGVLPATKQLTKSDDEVGKAFRLMPFNVLAHNKDDHSKNFAKLKGLAGSHTGARDSPPIRHSGLDPESERRECAPQVPRSKSFMAINAQPLEKAKLA